MASYLGQLLQALETVIITAFPTAIVNYDSLPIKDDGTPMPLLEIDVERIQCENFATGTMTTASISLIMHNRTANDRYTAAAMEEKIQTNQILRAILNTWQTPCTNNPQGGNFTLTSIHQRHFDSLNSGENGSYQNWTLKVGLLFDIQYYEAAKVSSSLVLQGLDFTQSTKSDIIALLTQ